jgi:hypothetical protein
MQPCRLLLSSKWQNTNKFKTMPEWQGASNLSLPKLTHPTSEMAGSLQRKLLDTRNLSLVN